MHSQMHSDSEMRRLHAEILSELRVSGVHVLGFGVAAVQLDVVHAPGGEGLGVGLKVAQRAGVAAAPG